QQNGEKTGSTAIEPVQAIGAAFANASACDQKKRGDKQDAAKRERDDMLGRNALQIELGKEDESCNRRRYAANRQENDEQPVDRSCGSVNDGTNRLGRCGKEQICTDG